jgi:Tfp pilus assembly protein PilN
MKAVNLIPKDSSAARREAGGPAVYVVLGALVAFVVLASLWTIASKQAGTDRARLDRATAEATAAEARAAAAQPYQEFARLAKDRVATIGSLARTRFDWSHAMREVSRVLPADVWLTEIAATSGAGAAAPSPTTSAAPAPTFKLDGCTVTQSKVALLMARLRAVDGVQQVDLSKSQKPDSKGDESCPANKASNPRFTISISFAAPAGSDVAAAATAQPSSSTGAAPAAAAPAAGSSSSSTTNAQ